MSKELVSSVIDKRDYHQSGIPYRGTTVQQHNCGRESSLMPAKAPWLLRVPVIIAMLETFDVPVVDRSVIEHLFGLRRRRAIELLHCFGGFQAGRTFLVDRLVLIDQLQRLTEGEEFQMEQRRKERLNDTIDQLRRHQAAARVKIPVPPNGFSLKLAGLAAGVSLEPGHLRIEFSGAEDLLCKLYGLSQAASHDFDRFRAAAEPAG
jgi:hypothetical protein